MRRHRTTARGIVLSLLLASLVAAAASPVAGGGSVDADPAAAKRTPSGLLARPGSALADLGLAHNRAVPRLVFPLVAKTVLWDNYGDPRGNGSHAGIDMENPWRAPVVAVEAGRVDYSDSNLGGCMLYLYGQSGTMYMYIHLNNDLTAKNDNRGGCVKDVAFAVPDGARVSAGQQVGWNGDSGDANGNPHLHFEVHPGGGADVNPIRHLKRAVHPLFAAKLGTPFSLGLGGVLVAAGAGAVELEVNRVRHYPGGRWLDIDTRTVELSVAPDAVIAPSLALLSATERRAPRAALPVVAHTVKAKTTIDAITGTTGVLTAGRVSPIR
jgi:hypothetical protein